MVERLAGALRATMELPDVKARLLELGIHAAFVGGDALNDMTIRIIEAWKQVAREAEISNE